MPDIQDVFNKFYPEFKRKYRTSLRQDKSAFDIMNCRTEVMGGHVDECEECGRINISYNSCGNRHCPLCQTIPKERWIDARKKDVLDAPYFHVVFTVPEEIRMLIYQNQKLLYGLLYSSVAQTLSELAGDIKYLGAQIGFISILHTWGQGIIYHPHVHTVVLAGGLTKMGEWKSSSKEFFIPVKVLSAKFSGKFLDCLKRYYYENKLNFFGSLGELENPENFQALLNNCYKKSWYTYCKEPFSGPLAVIEYLGRYTHRVAISNNRVVSMDEKTVTIKVKDYKDNCKEKLLTMSGSEFIRRFLMHILPKGFVKLRHFGILGNRNKKTKLELCRKLINSVIVFVSEYINMSAAEILMKITGKDITKCRACITGSVRPFYSFPKKPAPA
jgi:hypothetical protein